MDPQRLARAIEVLRKANREEEERKRANSVKFITDPKDYSRVYKSNKICCAITMSGKPCPFKASSQCGKFCKKHVIVE